VRPDIGSETVLGELKNKILKDSSLYSQKLTDIRFGLRYSAVLLESGKCGIAFSYGSELFVEDPPIKPGKMSDKAVKNVLSLPSDTFFTNVLQVATINALADVSSYETQQKDILDVLRINKEDIVSMIGAIHPFIERIKKNAKALYIFERWRNPHTTLYPDWAAPDILEQSDIVLFTGASVINKSFDVLINYVKSAREIVVVGPSTPLYPDTFKKRGVTLIGGIIITNPADALKIVSEAGGTRHLSVAYQKVAISLK